MLDYSGIAVEVLSGLKALYEPYQTKLQALTQFLLDNPNVGAVEFYNSAGALAIIYPVIHQIGLKIAQDLNIVLKNDV